MKGNELESLSQLLRAVASQHFKHIDEIASWCVQGTLVLSHNG